MTALLFTCEHGGHAIPPGDRHLFRGAAEVLRSHRGWDPGALELAQRFAQHFEAPLFAVTTSRLLVELNRSPHHPKLFSEFTRDLPRAEKERLLAAHYRPHREAVEQYLREQLAQRHRVLHVGVHSFTPELNGQQRQADIGLLYDPGRAWERRFCDAWRRALNSERCFRGANGDECLRVRKNYPYLGTADGFTTYLRRQFGDAQYAGIELEVNQAFPLGDKRRWRRLQQTLLDTLEMAIED